jgi:hypothetical protein
VATSVACGLYVASMIRLEKLEMLIDVFHSIHYQSHSGSLQVNLCILFRVGRSVQYLERYVT